MSDVLKHSKRIEPNAEFLNVTFLTKVRGRGRPKKQKHNTSKKIIAIVTKGNLCSIE
jgi:hypothetical protein